MKRNFRRLLVALFISASCFAGTRIWYNMGITKNTHVGANAVALLNAANNEVQRKPLKRVIWESISKNDELFPGEAVRTAPNAQADLYFTKSKTTVHLDPDSMVVLEENDKGLSLDFLQGNLFVQGGSNDGKGDGLTLKTANGDINVKSADMSLSKSQNGHINLEVHRGEAELSQGSKKTALDKEKSAELSDQGIKVANDRLQLVKPEAGQTLFLNLVKGEKLDLTWKAVAPDYTVSVEIGSTRSALEKMSGASASGAAGTLSIKPKPGHWFMRVTASASPESKLLPLVSTVVPFTIEPKAAPSLVEPRAEAALLKTESQAEQVFKWVGRNRYSSQVLEVATDALFKQVKSHVELEGEETTASVKLDDGKYFWRVTGFLKINGKTEALSSPALNFSLGSHWEVKPPVLQTPVNAQKLSFMEVQHSGVTLKWQTPQGIEKVKVSVQRKTAEGWKSFREQEVETPFLHLSEMTPGTYQWSVVSLDPHGGDPKAAAPLQFNVEEMLKLEWAETASEYVFRTPSPSLAAAWKAPNGPVAKYQFKLATESAGIDEAEWKASTQPAFEMNVPTEGNYVAVVQALNEKGQPIAQSDVKAFTVKRQPLLPAPQWTSDTPPVLKTDGKGNLSFAWQQVEGAQHYLMILESPEGQVIEQKEVSRTTASVSRLKPGEYQVHLKSVDQFKRAGLDGDKRKIQVPNTSDIRAPKIKAMKVK